MTYSYRCQTGHLTEINVRIGEQPEKETCATCEGVAERDFHADFSGVVFGVVDPFRNFHLSSTKMRAQAEQQRYVEGPTDNFERKILEKAYGRTYVGDDTSTMTKQGRESIERYKERKRAGERV